MTDPKNKTTAFVDDLLAEVSTVDAQPDDMLMARVLADAARLQAAPVVVPRPGLLTQLREVLGGWPGLGGVALAGIAGLWVGVVPPDRVENLAAELIGTTEAISLTEDANWLFEEGALDG